MPNEIFTGLFKSKDVSEDPCNRVCRGQPSHDQRAAWTGISPSGSAGRNPPACASECARDPRIRSSLPQPRLEEPFLAGIGKLLEMFLHAGLDPALTGLDLAAEPGDVGLACLEDRPRARSHLRRRARSREQQDGTGSYHENP